jgi:hypothetical protein
MGGIKMPEFASRWSGRLARATVVLWLAIAAPALAGECVFESQSYPEGTRIGDFVCENGEWVLGHRSTLPLDGAGRG